MNRLIKAAWRDRQGNVAMIFALTAIPLVAVVGAAVDYSSAASLQSQLQADTDAAALAACKSPQTSTSELKKVAQQALNGLSAGRVVQILDPFKATNNPRSITMTTQVTYEPRFMKFFGTMPVTTTTSCAAGENFYEIALVLDTTGSMTQSAGSGTKIEALRTAATNFVNTMFTNFESSQLQMSIVPFAASVKVDPDTYAPNNVPNATWIDSNGSSSIHWQNVSNPSTSSFNNRFDIFKKLKGVRSAWSWAGCFESLPYPYNTQDVTPSSGTPNTRYVPLFAPDEVGTRSTCSSWFGTYACTDDGGTSPVNTYLDDGSATSGSCNSLNNNKNTRMSQACKYVTPRNIDTGANGPNWGCTSRAITRLTSVKSTLTFEISQLSANGQTNIAEGLHWGWRTITNTGVFTDARDYGTAQTTKIVVLMTDGVNTWNHETDRGWFSTVYSVGDSEYSAYGYFKNADGSTAAGRFPPGTALATTADARNAMDKLTRETCTNMKAKGIVIYSVAFSTPGNAIDASGQQLIKDCASSPDKYFLASDASSLNTTFAAIAQGIGELRITR